MTKTRSAIKRHGGKSYFAKRIVDLLPPHLHFVEPYFGGGAVLFARDPYRDWMGDGQPSHLRGASEVANDIDGQLVNFWQVLKNPNQFDEFSRLVALTPFSQQVWEESEECHRDPVQDAVKFLVRNRQSRQGLGTSFATLSRNRTRRGMNEQVSAWLTAVDGLPEIHDRLQTVVILNDDALRVIASQDGPLTLFYCDPPYLHETRTSLKAYGENEMTVEQHQALLEVLSNIKGKFILSGYPSDLYAEFEYRHGWHRQEITIDNKASSKKTKDRMTECLWTNFIPNRGINSSKVKLDDISKEEK